jgi:hypothetical protein
VSASVFYISLSRQRQNRLCTLFQFPNSGGMSLSGAPDSLAAGLSDALELAERRAANELCRFVLPVCRA